MCFSLRVNIGEAVDGGARLALGLASCACPSSWPSVGRPSAVAVLVDFFSPIIDRDLFITPMIDRFFSSLIPKISQTSLGLVSGSWSPSLSRSPTSWPAR